MNNSGNKESSQFWQQSGFSTTFSKSAGIQIDKVIEPVMNDNIPLSIVRAKLNRVPPIRIEASVWKSSNLGPAVHPTCKNPKNPSTKKKVEGSISFIKVSMNVEKSSFAPSFSMAGLHISAYNIKAKNKIKN